MPVASPISLPHGAALRHWATRAMDVILHIGAHRTATASFQDYMRRHATDLAVQSVGFWRPRRPGQSLYRGVRSAGPDDAVARSRAETRIRSALDRARASGLRRLVISDPDMIGTLERNIGAARLYPDAGERMANLVHAFDGRISAVMLSSRSLDRYWCSALSGGISRGHGVPDRARLREIARSPRGWREVIHDLSDTLAGVPLRILPFERFAGRPDAFLAQGAGIVAPRAACRACLNPSPVLPELRRALMGRGDSAAVLPFGMGRWNPFTTDEHAALREKHADDMMWLTAGADGRAILTEDSPRDRAGSNLPSGDQQRGRRDEPEERHVARPG